MRVRAARRVDPHAARLRLPAALARDGRRVVPPALRGRAASGDPVRNRGRRRRARARLARADPPRVPAGARVRASARDGCCRDPRGPTASSGTRSSSSGATTRRSPRSIAWSRVRPSLASYARVAYARELTGDLPGAASAMRLALEAAGGQPEPTAWALVELSKLELSLGRVGVAEREARTALRRFRAIRTRGSSSRASTLSAVGFGAAVGDARRAADAVPDRPGRLAPRRPARATGRQAEARRQRATVARGRAAARARAASGSISSLRCTGRTTESGPHETVELARKARAARPSIYGDDALAWALARAGRCDEALPLAARALRLGTQRPAPLLPPRLRGGVRRKPLGHAQVVRASARRESRVLRALGSRGARGVDAIDTRHPERPRIIAA